ncbi:hypothetical protein ACRAWF_22020, partial [Streptomyces sp. L7]
VSRSTPRSVPAEDLGRRLSLTTLGAVPAPTGTARTARGGPARPRRAETVSQLRTRLTFSTGNGIPDSLLVSSARPEEGRTRTAIDLATSVADTGLRVVLLEADLRHPRLTAESRSARHPRASPTSLTRAHTSPHPLLESRGDGPIRVLPAGAVPPDPNTSPVLARHGDAAARAGDGGRSRGGGQPSPVVLRRRGRTRLA